MAVDRCLRPAALLAPAALVIAGCLAYFSGGASLPSPTRGPAAVGGRTVRIGTKNFTEQLILGELLAQLVEARTDLNVERRFNLGGTMICHGALESGEIDVYPEYTGTALTAILGQSAISDRQRAYDTVASQYRQRFAAEWLRPFGFNNTYVITVREHDAESLNLRTVSDLIPVSGTFRAGFTAEFSERPDGYPGLSRAYGLQFKEIRDLDPSLMYQAIAHGEVDVICAFATDGRIAAFDLHPLTDDRGFFPPYEAAPVVATDLLQVHPELRDVLGLLAGLLDDAAMQQLNFAVDGSKRRPKDVAREFLVARGLLEEVE